LQRLGTRKNSRKVPRFRKTLAEGIATAAFVATTACGAAQTQTATPEETPVSGPLSAEPLSESEVVLVREGNVLKAAVLEFESGDEGPTRIALQECKTAFNGCIGSLSGIKSVAGAHMTFVTFEGSGWKAVGKCEDVYARTAVQMTSADGPVQVHFGQCDISGVKKGRNVMVTFLPDEGQDIYTSDTSITR
jgi:hypothetical protein